jgi:pimeloyl-ACP methyl ester carboxylesterase
MALEAWDRQVMALGSSHTCVALDLRGHGHSPKPWDGYSYDHHAADVLALFERLDLHDIALVGWSMGGGVAARVAAQCADVTQLVLVGAPPRYLRNEDFPEGRSREDADAHWRNVLHNREDAMWETIIATCRIPQTDAVNRWLFALSVRGPVWAALKCYEGVLEADVRDDLRSLEIPILVLHGAHDIFISIHAARWVDENVERATLVEFADSGHAPHIEETERFNRHLLEFLESHGAEVPA